MSDDKPEVNESEENPEVEKGRTESAEPGLDDLKKLTDVSPQIQEILERLNLVGLSREATFKAIIKEIEKSENKEKDELKKFKSVVLELLRAEREKTETKIDPDVVGRAERDVAFAEEVRELEAGNKFNGQELGSVLERQNWGKIFNSLQEGDRVLSFLVPGADFLSIKHLNDVVMGPQITNKIIQEKRNAIARELEAMGVSAEILQSDYKTEIIKIPKDAKIDLEKIAENVDEKMTAFVSAIIDGLLSTEKNPDKIKVLEEFKNDLHGKSGKGGFKMNYGVSSVEGGRIDDKLLSLNHSLQTSRMARESQDGTRGAEYQEEKTLNELENIKNLRDKIKNEHGNKITDEEGNEFVIFSEVSGKSALNRDVLRDIRKGKFKTQDKALADLALYIKKLNILDVIKPFTHNKISEVEEKIKTTHEIAQKILTASEAKKEKTKSKEVDLTPKEVGLTSDEVKKAVEALRSEEKDPAYTSKSEFNRRATEMDKAAYISLDVLDLGVDLLLEYESTLQDVDKKTGRAKLEEFNTRSLSAGDLTTEKLKDFRAKVAKVYKKLGLNEDLVVGEVGGDELTLAIDTGKISEEKLREFLFELKEATNTRVIKTVAAETEKNVSPDSDDKNRVEAHLKAIKRGEEGVKIAKDIEEAARKLNRLLKKQTGAGGKPKGTRAVHALLAENVGDLRALFVVEDGAVRANVVVADKAGAFKVANLLGEEFDYKTIKDKLDTILGRKETEKSAEKNAAVA